MFAEFFADCYSGLFPSDSQLEIDRLLPNYAARFLICSAIVLGSLVVEFS